MSDTQRRRLLVRRPGPKLADGIVTHIERNVLDVALAQKQWDGYVAVFRNAGWEISEVAPEDDCPDAVFIEDPMCVFDDICVITRTGAAARAAEVVGAEAAATKLGLKISRIVEPGRLEGGDVLKVGNVVYVGVQVAAEHTRTNDEGVKQLASILGDKWTVKGVPISKALHLKSAVTALPNGTFIGYEPIVDDISVFQPFMSVPEEPGSHVVDIGDNTLVMASTAPQTAKLFQGLGYKTIAVDISEYEKLEGCVTCLSVRVRC